MPPTLVFLEWIKILIPTAVALGGLVGIYVKIRERLTRVETKVENLDEKLINMDLRIINIERMALNGTSDSSRSRKRRSSESD